MTVAPLCLDAFHDALNGGLAEVVRVGLHGQAVYANHYIVLPSWIYSTRYASYAPASLHLQNAVSNVIFAGAVRFHDCFNQVFRHISIVGQKLFGVLGQAVTAIAEAWVVVLIANAGIKAYALDDLLGVQSLHFRISIKLVEVRHTQCQIGVGEYSLTASASVKPMIRVSIFSLIAPSCSRPAKVLAAFTRRALSTSVPTMIRLGYRLSYRALDSRRKLRAEDDIVTVVLLTNRSCKADRNRGLDDHDGIRIILDDQLDNCFNRRGIKEVLLAIVVGRCCDDNEVCILIGSFSIKCGCQVQVLSLPDTFQCTRPE